MKQKHIVIFVIPFLLALGIFVNPIFLFLGIFSLCPLMHLFGGRGCHVTDEKHGKHGSELGKDEEHKRCH
ncbi:MAG: hypothetical protein GTO23_11065 [Nitrososphaeria archaeon]|nr:hypothetical protein [Nitrososphaeria archaeon]